ncbi:MAG: NUDIX domain-containing protein [Thermodesulfobacteriota bacterium]
MYSRKQADAQTRVKVGVGVFVKDPRGRILLERRSDSGMWGLPGGGIEPGESITRTALREVKEETGLEVRLTRLVGVYSEPGERIVTYPDNGDVRHLVDIILEAEIVSGELALSAESLELRFFPPEALPGEIAPPARQPVQDYLQGLKGIIR